MDDWSTEWYMHELMHQAETAQIAALDLNSALANRADDSLARAFAAVQALLAAGAMVSKMLWPQPASRQPDGSPLADEDEAARQYTLNRGRKLRGELGIKGLPVLESRRVRNALEHLDERLDRYLQAGNTILIDRNIGPRDGMIVIEGGTPPHLRHIDPVAGTVSFLDDEVSIQELFDAILDVAGRADKWLTARRP